MTIHFLSLQAYFQTADVVLELFNLLVSQFALVLMVIDFLQPFLLLLDLLLYKLLVDEGVYFLLSGLKWASQ